MQEQRPSNQPETDHTNRRDGHSVADTARRVGMGATAGLFGLAIGASLVAFGLFAGPKGTAAERTGSGPAVVELFTS